MKVFPINYYKCALVLCVAQLSAQKPASKVFRAIDHGVSVEAEIGSADATPGELLHENDDVRVSFRLSDASNGSPIGGAYISAWLARMPPDGSRQPDCNEVVSGLLNAKSGNAGVDLNNYYVLAMNDDATITVVDPLFGYGGTKLLALISLPSVAEDWAQLPDQDRLFVSLPEAKRVVVIDTRTWKVVAAVSVPSKPHRTILRPDGSQLWVTLDSGAIAVLSTSDPKLSGEVALGKGIHTLVFSENSRYALTTNSPDGTVSLIETGGLSATTIRAGSEPVSVAYSPLSKMFYITDRRAGIIQFIEPLSGTIAGKIPLQAGLGEIRFAPGGRYGFVLNPEKDLLYLFDTAVNQLIQTLQTERGPDQIVFSDRLAYVRHRGSETVLVVSLDAIGKKDAPVAPADFQAGQHPFGEISKPSPADGLAPAPGENAVLVANPADKAIYYYRVGMAAPQGSFTNYSRQPRAVMVVNRSKKPNEPGVYSTVMRLPGQGSYRLAMLIDSPRVVQCFPVQVEAAPRAASTEPPVRIEFAALRASPIAGQKVHIQFRVLSNSMQIGRNLNPAIRVMVMLQGGNWSNPNPQFAVPEGGGVYGFDAFPPEPGHYVVLLECQSLDLPLHRSPQLQFDVQP
jgi:DNA-binding beta-propeller fold protein YncE